MAQTFKISTIPVANTKDIHPQTTTPLLFHLVIPINQSFRIKHGASRQAHHP